MKVERIRLFDNPNANLYSYILDPKISTGVYKKRPAVIICPGGAYLKTATKEGEAVATHFLAHGYHSFVLRYSTYFTEDHKKNEASVFPIQLLELMESIRIIKENADAWSIDVDNIFLVGFSAGGHLVTNLATRWDEENFTDRFGQSKSFFKPKGIILGYPFLNTEADMDHVDVNVNQALFGKDRPSLRERQALNVINYVRKDMPPVFLWHTYDDEITKAKDSITFVSKLYEYNVENEVHIFSSGKHGLGMADKVSAKMASDINDEVAMWFPLVLNWLNAQRNKI